MKMRDLVEALKPLEGYKIALLVEDEADEVQVLTLDCVGVRYLSPRERADEGQGNVLLWNGDIGEGGASSGLTIQAGRVKEARWEENGLYLVLVTGSGKARVQCTEQLVNRNERRSTND